MKIGSSQKAYINYLKMKKNYKLKKSSSGYFYIHPSPNKEYLDKYYKFFYELNIGRDMTYLLKKVN